MEDKATLTSPAPLAPLPTRERIEALDVVRGFALIGICLMNLDFFNRSVLMVGTGLPPGLTGIDYWAAFFTGYFVTAKFWTMFSLLFGMGFAVMLTRAEQAGRGFIQPYLRRIFALAVFGAAHHIFIWGGDILFSYAVAALFLLLAMYGGWKTIVAGLILFGGLAAIPGMNDYGAAVPTFAITGLVALYLRNDSRRFSLPTISLLLFVLAFLCVVAGLVMLVVGGPKQIAFPVLVASAILSFLGWLAKRYQDPASKRPLRAGAALWVLVFGMATIGTGVQYLTAKPEGQPATVATAPQTAAEKEAAAKEARQKEERAKAQQERADKVAFDTKVVSTGTYAEGVAERARQFLHRPPKELGFAMILMGVFLIGTWFVRSGIMANTAAHLPLFRKLALIGIPLGVGIGLLGSLVATSVNAPGTPDNGFHFAFSMLMLGSLPASIGYASAVILALHSNSWLSKVRVLAPFGRMALTNYLMQSLVCAVFFYGWGFGNWGMGRAAQLGFALALCAVQVVISHLWLQHFRYGPLEWLWRAVTYMKVPAMRIERAPEGAVPQPN